MKVFREIQRETVRTGYQLVKSYWKVFFGGFLVYLVFGKLLSRLTISMADIFYYRELMDVLSLLLLYPILVFSGAVFFEVSGNDSGGNNVFSWLRSEGLHGSFLAFRVAGFFFGLIGVSIGAVLLGFGILSFYSELLASVVPLIFQDVVRWLVYLLFAIVITVTIAWFFWLRILTITMPARVLVEDVNFSEAFWTEKNLAFVRIRDYFGFLLVMGVVQGVTSGWIGLVSRLIHFWIFVSIFVVEARLIHYDRESETIESECVR